MFSVFRSNLFGHKRPSGSAPRRRARRRRVEPLEPRAMLSGVPFGAEIDDTAEFMLGDVVDFMDARRAAYGMDAVVHLGARSGNSHWDPENVMQTNLMGTYFVLKACEEHGIRTLIYASSECALGYASDRLQRRQALENVTPIHEVFYLTASTPVVASPTGEIIARYFPGVANVAPDLTGT